MAAVQRIWAVVPKCWTSISAHVNSTHVDRQKLRLAFWSLVSFGVGIGPGLPLAAQPPKTTKPATNQTQVQDKNKPQAPKGTPQAALNIFADAANFQNNGQFDLSIVEWKKLIGQFPKDPIVSKAHHYLGVCYLRSMPPLYDEAIKSFEMALVDKTLEVREESLFNLGWCLYVQGRDAEEGKRKPRLNQSIEVLQNYLKSYGDGSVADRALFYAAECQYLLGDHEKAATLYKQLVSSPNYLKSSIRPDAIYAMGVNYEELKKDAQAKDAFDEFLKLHADHKLATDVRLRRAEIGIKNGENDVAIVLLKKVVDAGDATNKDYALYRYGFALAKGGKFNESAEVYKRLSKDFPDSQYSKAGVLAAGQTLMRDKRFDEAAEFFKRLLVSKDERAAEAAHWLCQIHLLQGKASEASPIARDALGWGGDSPSAVLLRMDLAESLMEQPEGRAEARALFENLATQQSDDPLAPRATYNAAFLALQSGEPAEAKKWASNFISKFVKDPLAPDASYVLAESSLQLGEHADAIQLFDKLVRDQKNDPMVPIYQLRSATARFLKGDLDATIEFLNKAVGGLKQPPQQAEAFFLIGASQMRQSKYKEAIATLAKANQIAPKWAKADESLLIQSQAYQQDEKIDEAITTLNSLIREFPNSRFKQQAELRVGQLLVGKGDFDKAISLYDGILESKTPTINLEFVSYAKAYALMQLKKFEPAIALLEPIASSDRKDNVATESRLALGISQRSIDKFSESIKTLQQVVDMGAEGDSLANALYEQALSFAKNGEADRAKANFQRIRKEFPNYKSLDKVLYEGAWISKELGEMEESNALFKELSQKFPKSPLAGEANFHEGQVQYAQEKFDLAIKAYNVSYATSSDSSIQEKSLHKMGWAYFKLQDYEKAAEQFSKQLDHFPEGELVVDATFMQAQCAFKRDKFENAFSLYKKARRSLEELPDPKSVSDTIKTLIYLQGAQSARELKQWDQTEAWLNVVRTKYSESAYLPEALFELANCYQNQHKPEQSLELYSEVSNKNRNEIGARARFMMGEVYFAQKEFAKAIPEFRRVMFGYGAQQAPDTVKNWQARSAVEAGRCAELLIGDLSGENRTKAIGIARDFYKYVLDNHPQHEFAKQAETRIAALNRM